MQQQQQQEVTQKVLPGWKVVGSDDKDIGQVNDLGQSWLEVSKGLILTKTLYVPYEFIDHEDDLNERVFLRVGKDAVDQMGWDRPPGDGPDDTTDLSAGGTGTGDDAFRMPR